MSTEASPTPQQTLPTEAPQSSSPLNREEILRKAGVGAPAPSQAPTAAPTASGGSGLLNAVSGAIPAAGALRVADQVGLSDYLAGPAEAAMTMGSSIVAEPLAGLAGLKETFFGDGASAGADTVEAVRQALTYTPKTEEGRAAMEAVGAFLAPVGDALTATSETLGDTAEALGAPPSVSTMMYTLPEAVLSVVPAGLGIKAARTTKATKETANAVRRGEMLAKDPTLRVNSPFGADWKLKPNGTAEVNTVGRKLVTDGVDAADAALVTNSNKATRTQMEVMKRAWEDAAKGATKADATAVRSPSQILGSNAAKAVGEINKARQKVGKQIDEMVSGKLGNTKVNINEPLGNFYQELTNMGVKTRVGRDGVQRLDFDGTVLEGKSFGSARAVMEDAFAMTLNRGGNNLREAHKLKNNLDNLLDAKKLEQGGQLGKVERLVADLRKGVNETAGKQVDGYAQVNAQYGALRDALNPFDSYKPAGVSWDSAQAANNVGAAMRSAAADTASMNNMMQGLADGARVMHSVGAKPFTVDVVGLARFNDMLNTQLIKSVNTTASKDIARGFMNNATGGAISAGVGNVYGVANNAVGALRNLGDASTINAALARNQMILNNVGTALRAP